MSPFGKIQRQYKFVRDEDVFFWRLYCEWHQPGSDKCGCEFVSLFHENDVFSFFDKDQIGNKSAFYARITCEMLKEDL